MEKKYVLITGGQLENKGAQAMTFITVTQAKKLFPDCEVVLLSNFDAERDEAVKKNYKFMIHGFPSIHFPFEMPFYVNGPINKEFRELFRNAVCLFDISGYRLGSNWGMKKALTYSGTIRLAKRYGVPVYIMPQSFGPFDFNGIFGSSVMRSIKKALDYPKTIMARETEGKELLERQFGLSNVVKTSDMVIQSPAAQPEEIYHELPQLREVDVAEDSVALIPNSKNNQYGDTGSIDRLYEKIIGYLLNNGKHVYLIYHSVNDQDICHQLKAKYADNDSVVLVDQELSCLEYSLNIPKFDYIIASRFHSIVHAYKEGIPALIIGWAIKYRELAKDFGQEDFCANVTALNDDEVLEKLADMNSSFEKQSAVIRDRLKVIEQNNVFDYVK